MIEEIKADLVLSNYLEDTCCENGICVEFDSKVDPNDVIIIKVDKFYNDNIINPGPSVDCLIIRKCKNSGYGITLVELKSSSSAGNIDFENIKQKFSNTLEDFMTVRFGKYFLREYIDFKIFLVSNLELYKRDVSLKLEILSNIYFEFENRTYLVQPYIPNPAIKNCYV